MKVSFIDRISVVLFSIGIVLRSGGGTISFISPVAIIISSIVLSFVALLAKRERPNVSITNQISLVLIFFLYLLLSLVFTMSPSYGISKIVWLFFWVFCFIIVSPLISRNFVFFLFSLFIAQIILLISLYSHFGSPFALLKDVNVFFRLGDEATNPITFSRMLGFTSLSTIFYLNHDKKFQRYKTIMTIFCIMIILVSLMYMFFSGSKGPILSFLLSLIAFFALRYRLSIRTIIIYSLFVITGYLLISVLLSNSLLLDFVQYRFTESEGSFSSREIRLFAAINQVISNDTKWYELFFGAGSGNFSYLYNYEDTMSYPHNLIVELLYEYGIIGFGLFIVAFVKPVLNSVSSRGSYDQIVLLVFWLYLFINSMVSGDIVSNFLLFGISVLFIYYQKKVRYEI